MTTTRKQYSPKFKARVAIGGDPRGEDAEPVGLAVPGASDADRRSGARRRWSNCRSCSWTGASGSARMSDVERDALYEEIGRLKVELDWLKKKVGLLD